MLPWLVRDAPTVLGGRRAGLLLGLILIELWVDGLVLASANVFGPSFSPAQRQNSFVVTGAATLATQLGAWVLVGACARLATTWSGRQWQRLSSLP
ncbi:MAG: hypothetical protein ABIQ12_10365 [Opitutaceae bacterium]